MNGANPLSERQNETTKGAKGLVFRNAPAPLLAAHVHGLHRHNSETVV